MKIFERNKALELRSQGLTFGEILKQVSASKSSLSYWLRGVKLTNEQLLRIKYKNDKIKDSFIKFNELQQKASKNRKLDIASEAAKEISKISGKELKLIGIALYWAEGYTKNSDWGSVSFTNSDPKMIQLMMAWFRLVCKVPESKFRIKIQCYNPGKIDIYKIHWSKVTGIALSQFNKPYMRISPTSQNKMGELSPYGTCHIRISDVALLTRIRGWIKGLNGAIV